MTQAASAPHRMPSSSTVFARCTKSLSTRWAMVALIPNSKSPPVPNDRDLCAFPLSMKGLQRQTRVAMHAWLTLSFMQCLRRNRRNRPQDRAGRGLAEEIGEAYQREEYQEEQREQDESNALGDAREVGQSQGPAINERTRKKTAYLN